jgi:hypothetical protein
MTDEELAAVKARCDAATPGPWQSEYDNCGNGGFSEWWNVGSGLMNEEADAAFIAHAREDVPALLAEIGRLKSLLASAEK